MEIPASLLIVDDEPMVRSALAEFLRDYKFQVTTVGSAEAALQMMNACRFEVIIVDLRLPGINGENLILKAHAMDPGVKFIIHTGSASYMLSDDLIRIGIEPRQIFLKPLLNLSLFLKAIDGLIKNRSFGNA